MDREAAVIRSEMSHTRVELDRKLTRLETRARDMSPRRLARRMMPAYLLDRAIGGLLTLVGASMAWRRLRPRSPVQA